MMTLKRHHIHAISKIHNCYLLDFHLAGGMWRVLKDLSQLIHEAACCLFNMAWAIGVETVEWIAEAKKQCGLLGRSHGWNWNGEECLDSNRFPLLEGQPLIAEPALEPSNSNTLILHPCYLNKARAQASAVFPSPTQFSQLPAYLSTNYDADIDLANAICNMNVAE